jgi:hypothetical protein
MASSRPIHISHRVDAVHHEVHQHLLELHAISHDLREVCSEFRPNEYGEFRCLAVQEKHHLSNNLVQIEQLPLQSILLEEQTDSVDDFARTLSVLFDS